jgi:hypothetical protein
MLKLIVKEETLARATGIIADANGIGPVMTGRHFAFVEDGMLKAVIGLKRKSFYMTEVCHLVVLPEYTEEISRLAGSTASAVLQHVETPLACCTIPARNQVALDIALNLGFHISETFIGSKGRVFFLVKQS